jgi:CRISPR-associated endonuclease Cas3-HD
MGQRKQKKLKNMKEKKPKNRLKRTAITVSEAIGAFERAFRTRNPNEVEQLLREMLNVQVAVVRSREEAESLLNGGKKFKTVPVPYRLFIGKIREILKKKQESTNGESHRIYSVERNSIISSNSKYYMVEPIYSSESVVPGKTYILLSEIAGYSSSEGLTFEGLGDPTGYEDLPEAEKREKDGEGYFQLWKDHIEGVWKHSEEIGKIYYPFIRNWAQRALAPQLENDNNGKQIEDFTNAIIYAMRIATLFHDIGKLNKKWQNIVWENEEKIRKGAFKREKIDEFIARTSPITDEKTRKEIKKPRPHAPFTYPFLRTFLRHMLGDFRFLDTIALASARHHSLDVPGSVRQGDFNLMEKADDFLKDLLSQMLQLKDKDKEKVFDVLTHAINMTHSGSEADEPPSPSDDFYFIYCLTNRMVKFCDWEDAGNQIIELTSLRKR